MSCSALQETKKASRDGATKDGAAKDKDTPRASAAKQSRLNPSTTEPAAKSSKKAYFTPKTKEEPKVKLEQPQ